MNPTFIFTGLILIVIATLLYLSTKTIESKKSNTGSSRKNKKGALASFTTDFTALATEGKLDPVIGRTEEITRLTQILARRTKNNALLIGPPGIGKTAIVEGLAQKIASGDIPSDLRDQHILSLDVTALMAGTKYRGEFEKRAKEIVKEIEQANRSLILFIDEIHTIIQSHGSEGALNFADILKPGLARGDLQMIGATTQEEYEKYIKDEASFDRRFQPIQIQEPTVEETLEILHGIKDKFREYHKVEFTDAALELAASLSSRFLEQRRLPDKAIDAMDEAAARVKVTHVHQDIPILLYQAALKKHPEIKKIWEELQTIDGSKKTKKNQKEIGELEEDLEQVGVMVVDAGDIETVIKEWES